MAKGNKSCANPDADPRSQYWGANYARYWQSRVSESNIPQGAASHINQQDTISTSDAVYLRCAQLLEIKSNEVVLELGCGFGRSIPYLAAKARHVVGVDISKEMITAARKSYGDLPNVEFKISVGESMPFSDAYFDAVMCFGVFDAMYQREALIEISRVMKFGGRALLTGKNDDYDDSDQAALIAEDKARQKGHPNYFTDMRKLRAKFPAFGFRLTEEKYFRARGDFGTCKFDREMPSHFYEYVVVLQRTATTDTEQCGKISNAFSKSWRRVYKSA